MIWKDLPKELNLSRYQVSDYGNIKNKRTGYLFQNKPHVCSGYISASLNSDDGKMKSVKLHRLVASTFIPNPNNHPLWITLIE